MMTSDDSDDADDDKYNDGNEYKHNHLVLADKADIFLWIELRHNNDSMSKSQVLAYCGYNSELVRHGYDDKRYFVRCQLVVVKGVAAVHSCTKAKMKVL